MGISAAVIGEGVADVGGAAAVDAGATAAIGAGAADVGIGAAAGDFAGAGFAGGDIAAAGAAGSGAVGAGGIAGDFAGAGFAGADVTAAGGAGAAGAFGEGLGGYFGSGDLTANATGSLAQQFTNATGFGNGTWGSLLSAAGGANGSSGFGPVSGGLSVANGVNSLYQSQQQRKLAAQMAQNPWAAQQGQYQQQLQQLMANPSSVTSLPGYQFQFNQGQQALARQSAAAGYGGTGANPGSGGGSGNFATAEQQYGQGFAQNSYNNQVQQLSGLSGVNQGNPAAAINSLGTSNVGTTQGLNTLAYGAQRLGW